VQHPQAEITVDERGRTSLAKVTTRDHRRYLVEELDDGTLVLTPAVTISALEAAALADPEIRAAIEASLDPSTPRTTRGSFSDRIAD
jgi:hypothetical protein